MPVFATYNSRPRSPLVLAGFLALSCAICAVRAFLSWIDVRSIWFTHLAKPIFFPPQQVFFPIWLVIYTLAAFAAWFIWRLPDSALRLDALILYGLQLLFSLLISPLFFSFHHITLALIDIVLLDLTLLLTFVAFWHIRRLAGALLVPYILWSTFITILCVSLLQLN